MSRQLKLMISVNVLFGLLYVYLSYSVWESIYSFITVNWADLVAPYYWSPLTMYLSTGAFWGFSIDVVNTPFILFWVVLATNIYFVVKIERSREVKQNTT